MKLKINKEKESLKPNFNSKKVNNSKVDAAREKIQEELATDIAHSAYDVEITGEDHIKARKKFKSIKTKKIIFYISIILLMFIVMICAVYKTFFKHEYTGEEIANISNFYNSKTNFPESGVSGYIEENIVSIMSDRISYDKDLANIKYEKPILTRINPKNDLIANVYFYLTINSVKGNDKISCMMPIFYDKSVNKYYPCGDVIVTPLETSADSTSKKDNPLMSFEGKPQESDENTNASKTFITNFFTMLYSGQDITPYYDGKQLNVKGLKFNGIEDYFLFKEENSNGYNTKCTISLTSSTGLVFKTTKYLTISKTGSSWMIENVL